MVGFHLQREGTFKNYVSCSNVSINLSKIIYRILSRPVFERSQISPLRNRENVSNMYTRTEISYKLCIPSSISYWNNLQTDIKEANIYASFHQRLKPIIYDRIKVPIYFVEGNRKLSILHADIRTNCSDLKNDLFRNHLSADSRCSCGNENEDTSHYFFECENFNNLRVLMFHRTRPSHPLSLHMMLYGKPSLSNDEYFLLFQTVHALIKASGRFS